MTKQILRKHIRCVLFATFELNMQTKNISFLQKSHILENLIFLHYQSDVSKLFGCRKVKVYALLLLCLVYKRRQESLEGKLV